MLPELKQSKDAEAMMMTCLQPCRLKQRKLTIHTKETPRSWRHAVPGYELKEKVKVEQLDPNQDHNPGCILHTIGRWRDQL
jgi:hypothetical protein